MDLSLSRCWLNLHFFVSFPWSQCFISAVLCVLKTTPQSLRRHLDFLSLKFLNFLMIAPIDPIAPYYSFPAAIAIHIDLIFMCVEILKLRFHDCCFIFRYLIDDCWVLVTLNFEFWIFMVTFLRPSPQESSWCWWWYTRRWHCLFCCSRSVLYWRCVIRHVAN